jgi:hypothetical protein
VTGDYIWLLKSNSEGRSDVRNVEFGHLQTRGDPAAAATAPHILRFNKRCVPIEYSKIFLVFSTKKGAGLSRYSN